MTVHIMRNIAACATSDWRPMLIQAIDMDQPPGIGMSEDMPRAEWTVYVHAAIVTTAATSVVLVDALTLTDGPIEYLDEMHDAERTAGCFESRRYLQQAAGVARNDRF